jgi:enoyl-CoA hydratase
MGMSSEPGRIWTVTLDSPPANAIGWDLITGLETVLQEIDPQTTKVLVIRAAGRFFSAGVDISLIRRAAEADDGAEQIATFGRRLQGVFQQLEDLPIPTIAVIQGHALGGGFELALSCDLRVADETASIGLPETKLGLIPGAGGTQRLTRVAGRGTALRLILRGELAQAPWAERAGLVQWCVPHGTAGSFADELAAELAGLPQQAMAASKRSVSLACSAEGYASEIDQTRDLLGSPETKSRLTDFLSKSSAPRGEGA